MEEKHTHTKNINLRFENMANNQAITEARLETALARYTYEACSDNRVITERTFDETVDAAVECIKTDIEQGCATNEAKAAAKQEAEYAFRLIASRFKAEFLQSGVLKRY